MYKKVWFLRNFRLIKDEMTSCLIDFDLLMNFIKLTIA